MTKNTTMVGAEQNDLVDSFSSSSFSSPGLSSSESDSSEEVTSPAYSSSSSSSDHQLATDPLLDMSSLFQQLPIKRGLSKHYQGKSQSFTSLANVRSVEDLAKPENPYNKKLKCCRRSYGGGFVGETHRASKCSSSSNTLSRQICKSSRGSCSSLTVRRGSANLDITASRPPMPPHRSTSATTTIPNETPLFA